MSLAYVNASQAVRALDAERGVSGRAAVLFTATSIVSLNLLLIVDMLAGAGSGMISSAHASSAASFVGVAEAVMLALVWFGRDSRRR